MERTALLVIDMQAGLFSPGTPRHDAAGVVGRVNAVARAVRQSGGIVVFIQHDGPPGGDFEPHTPGWELLPSLERMTEDLVVHKTACDSFYETELEIILTQRGLRRLLIAGCATEFCVDTTVRAAMSHGYDVTVVSDGHTTADRPHVDASSLIRHHNWLWPELIHPKVRVRVASAADVISGLKAGDEGDAIRPARR